MKSKETLIALSAFWGLTVLVGCVNMPMGERMVTQGANPAFSPDGRRIAFQRLDGEVFKIGVVGLDDNKVEWIEEGPGNAAYPEWTPSGGLIYMSGNNKDTAYEAWRSNSKSGYGLCLWENGKKRNLTTGRCRDFTPSVSADGKKVYFVTTRGVTSESEVYSNAATTHIAELDLVAGGESRIIMKSPGGNDTGFVQPAISPDGKILVWGHLESFFDAWRIYGTRIGKFGKQEWCQVSPNALNAISPRWHPNGKLISFTGFRKGDPGWGVWVEEIETGKVKRLATGENPCFSADGRWLAYDRDGMVYVRPFGTADMPDVILPESRDDDERDDGELEKVLWSNENIAKETRFEATDPQFAFGKDKTVFVRLKVKLDGSAGLRQLFIGDYSEHCLGFQMHVNRDIWFSTRTATERFVGICDKNNYRSPGEYTLVGIRTAKRILISVNGLSPRNLPCDTMSLDHPLRFIAGRGLKPGESVVKVEIGTGWPKDVPKLKKREDLSK